MITRRAVGVVLKIVLPMAILAYLARDAYENDAFGQLASRPKNWWLLAAAALSCASAVMLTMVRWYYLVRSLGIELRFSESLRFSFLGYLFNFAPMGIVGGDLLKMVLLARRFRGRKAEALASVFVDRVVGLYLLFVLAAVALFASGFWRIDRVAVHRVTLFTVVATAAATLGMAVLMFRDMRRAWTIRLIAALPYVGPKLAHSVRQIGLAVQMYRRQPGVLLSAAMMSLTVHCLFSCGLFLLAQGLYDRSPSLATHLVVSPLSAATGVVPIALGPFEWVLDRLYTYVPIAAGAMKPGQGFVVALGYRIITALVAVVGMFYYLASRAEVGRVLEEVERDSPAPPFMAATPAEAMA